MNDEDALKLLELLAKYGVEYAPDVPLTVPALAEDLANSMTTINEAIAQQHLSQVRRAWSKY